MVPNPQEKCCKPGAQGGSCSLNRDVTRNRELFLGKIIGTLADTLEELVGPEEVQSFLTQVGTVLGRKLNDEYREQFNAKKLSARQTAAALIDLKTKIGGNFEVAEFTGNNFTIKNSSCPFGENINGRPSMCQIECSIFGRIVADNLGYARITIEDSIANGAPGCTVVIELDDTGSSGDFFNEYFEQSEIADDDARRTRL